MADIAAQRAALAETRARIDARLDELTDHVPARSDLKATAVKYGSAVAGVAVGIGVLVIATKSRLHGRRTRSEARSYATALLSALPELADAYRDHAARQPATATPRKDLRAELKAEAAKVKLDAARHRMEQANATRIAAIESGDVPTPPRGGVGSAILMAAGVIGGVAAAQALGRGQGGS